MSSLRVHATSFAPSASRGPGLTGARRPACLLALVLGTAAFPGCMSALTATTLREALRETAASLSTPHDLDHASQGGGKKRADVDDETGDPVDASSDALGAAEEVAMEEVIDNAVARLSAAGGIDPATQELLIQTLEKTPPQDWAVVVNEFAASLEAARGSAPRSAGVALPEGGSASRRASQAAEETAVVADAPKKQTGGLVMPATAPDATAPAPLDLVGIEVAPIPAVPTAVAPPLPEPAPIVPAVMPASPPPTDPQRPAVVTPAVVQPAVALIEIEPSPSATVAPLPEAAGPMPPEPDAFEIAERRSDAPTAPRSGPMVNNPCFATRVRGWGQVERFPGTAFRAGQEIIVYFELDSLRIDATEKGHTTGIDTAFRLLDGAGEQVGQWSFEPIVETCPSPRRDYYVRYFVRIPDSARPGRHRLEWTVTDTVAGASRQAHLDLEVLPAE